MEPPRLVGVGRNLENLIPNFEQSHRIDLGSENMDALPRCRIAVCQWDPSKLVSGSGRWSRLMQSGEERGQIVRSDRWIERPPVPYRLAGDPR